MMNSSKLLCRQYEGLNPQLQKVVRRQWAILFDQNVFLRDCGNDPTVYQYSTNLFLQDAAGSIYGPTHDTRVRTYMDHTVDTYLGFNYYPG